MRDSSADKPTDAQVRLFRAQGVRVWGCYFNGPGSRWDWTDADYQTARGVGDLVMFAFWGADPIAARDKAAQVGAWLMLDVEPPYDDGLEVDPWLARSGAGMYGRESYLRRHQGHYPRAILAAYPPVWVAGRLYTQDPQTHQPQGLDLGVPMGWQWRGTHLENGVSCDSSWLDPSFYRGARPAAEYGASSSGSGSMVVCTGPQSGVRYRVTIGARDGRLWVTAEDGIRNHGPLTGTPPEGMVSVTYLLDPNLHGVGLDPLPGGDLPMPGSVCAEWSPDEHWFAVSCIGRVPQDADGTLRTYVNEWGGGGWSGWLTVPTLRSDLAHLGGPAGPPGPAGPSGAVAAHTHVTTGPITNQG